jgi:hypothetical protein
MRSLMTGYRPHLASLDGFNDAQRVMTRAWRIAEEFSNVWVLTDDVTSAEFGAALK